MPPRMEQRTDGSGNDVEELADQGTGDETVRAARQISADGRAVYDPLFLDVRTVDRTEMTGRPVVPHHNTTHRRRRRGAHRTRRGSEWRPGNGVPALSTP